MEIMNRININDIADILILKKEMTSFRIELTIFFSLNTS